MPKVKYCRGAIVIYKDSPLTVIDSHWRKYRTPGWFYDLGSIQLSFQVDGISESQLSSAT